MAIAVPPETSSVFHRLSTLADTTRSRLLLVLEAHDFTVGELCTILQLPQSTVSRHLKVLVDEGWMVFRQDGTSRHYQMTPGGLAPQAQELWRLVRSEVVGLPAACQDLLRAESVLEQRRTRSQEFFASTAGRWDQLRTEMFGDHLELHAMLGLLDPTWSVGDLGCGTGRVSAALAPFVGQVISVDVSEPMLDAARSTLNGIDNVEVRRGNLEALPIADGSLDVAVLFLVLHTIVDPPRVLAEVSRVLRPGGTLLIADMTAHDRREYQMEMGHVWLGISRERLAGWLDEAGFDRFVHHPLSPDHGANGPAVFVATAHTSLSTP